MGTNIWSAYAGIQTYLSTGLNSLANDANKLGTAISNGTNRSLFCDWEFVLASVDLSSQTNPAIYLYLLKRVDGANYEDGSDSVDPAKPPVKIISLREFNGAQRVITEVPMIIPPGDFKVLLKNKGGAAFAASGNTLKYNIHSLEY